MKLATLPGGTRDGRLAVVSGDFSRAAFAGPQLATLQQAIESWATATPRLEAISRRLDEGTEPASFAFSPAEALAPLPRAFQFLDASAYLNHGRLMQQAFNLAPNDESLPLMYQGASDDFLGAQQDALFPSIADGIDFEAELGVILGEVPMGVRPQDAERHILMFVLINDWSLRALAAREMKAGFGFVQAKPSTAFGPVAVTRDELAGHFKDGRLHLRMHVTFRGGPFGDLDTSAMDYSFGELIAFAARTRTLRAGTILGSGTVSNAGRGAGSGCLSERRVIEMIDHGAATTPFMANGDHIRIETTDLNGRSIFGAVSQRAVLLA